MLSDALSTAHSVLEDVPEESFGPPGKHVTLGALLLVAEGVSHDFHNARAEVLGSSE
jgi:hypothetical protein